MNIRPMKTDHTQINKLLTAGIIAGPFFIMIALIQAFTREGFDWVSHPASLLSLGSLGWIQIANFVLTGLFYIAMAYGLKHVLSSGIGRRWVPRLFTVLGIAMIAGGVFLADPSLGFPPGAPVMPENQSWHSVVHGFAPIIGFLALTIALITLGRRFGSQGQKWWMWATILIALASYALSSIPSLTGNFETGEFNFIPLWAGVTLGFGYTSVIAAKFKHSYNYLGNQKSYAKDRSSFMV